MKSVCLVGKAPNTLEGYNKTRCDEQWSLNTTVASGMHFNNLTRLFEMHPPSFLKHPLYDPNPDYDYWTWLTTTKHPYRVMMLEAYPEVHNSEAYPLEIIETDIIQHDGENVLYSTATFAYMLALAIEEYDFIELYGFDLPSNTEWSYQKPGVEHWLGVARERGVRVWIHGKSKLLKGALYGYENAQMIGRQQLEGYRDIYKNLKIEFLSKVNRATGHLEANVDPEMVNMLSAEVNRLYLLTHQYAAIETFSDRLVRICDGEKISPDELKRIRD